jgi:hypothetical protein
MGASPGVRGSRRIVATVVTSGAAAGKGIDGPLSKPWGVGRPGRLQRHLDVEIDEVLATIVLVAGDDALSDRSFGQLVDLLVERSFASLRADYLESRTEPDAYRCQVRTLDQACRRAGLLGPRG